jgi:hypothetical protein
MNISALCPQDTGIACGHRPAWLLQTQGMGTVTALMAWARRVREVTECGGGDRVWLV